MYVSQSQLLSQLVSKCNKAPSKALQGPVRPDKASKLRQTSQAGWKMVDFCINVNVHNNCMCA